MDAMVETPAAPPAQRLRQRRQRWLIILTVGLVLVALAVGAWWLLYASHYQNTDDAYVAGDLVNVMPEVTGTVISIGADETDLVKAGEELIRLEPTDARIALEDAEEQLARTVRQTRTVFANRDQLTSTAARTSPPAARSRARNSGTRAMS
jgi:membrane fusion protein (multidrug efflux system)